MARQKKNKRSHSSASDSGSSSRHSRPVKPARGPGGAGGAVPTKKHSFTFVDRTGKVHGLKQGHGAKPGHGGGAEAPGRFEVRSPARVPRAEQPARARSAEHAPRPEPKSTPRPARSPWQGRKPAHGKSSNGDGDGGGGGRKFRGGKHEGERGGRSHEVVKLKATIDKNRKGFGFLIFENRQYEDAFIPPREADALFHGDRVEVTLGGRGHVHEIKVLEHRFRELVGRFTPNPVGRHRGGWIVYEQKRAREEVYIPQIAPSLKLAAGDWIRAKLSFHEKGEFPVTAEVVEVFGAELPASADLRMVAANFSLIEEHSEAAEREARGLTLEVPGKDLEGREDLRAVPFITIDGETARDFDDAVYVERNRAGYTLWVAIADVSHYVREGNALDVDARSRGTSVYFPERAFHMLPRALSENLCSLKPNEPRLSMVARMELDADGGLQSTEMMEAVIESKRRATYNQIQEEWDKNRGNSDWEYAPHFELYARIRKQRSARGSIDFDLPEAELKVEPNGEVISIQERPRLDAHRLIEEFMIMANEAVTGWMMEREWPFIYRVHEEPSLEKLEKFQRLAANVGVRFSLDETVSPKVMADLVLRLEGHPAAALLNTALLRSMKQAVYSSTHGIHFGLASQGYTHFTSPIRRYPDLVVHRLLRAALAVEKKRARMPQGDAREGLEAKLAEICEHCSYRERLASDAERESIKLKQVRAMMKHLGDEFEGKIVGMVDAGMFVKIRDPYCEGMVTQESMTDDFYQFNEERMIFYGKRKKRTFKMGDAMKVRCVKADIESRQIEFGEITDGVQPARGREPGFTPERALDRLHFEPRRGERDRGGDRGGKGPRRGPGKRQGGNKNKGKRRGRR